MCEANAYVAVNGSEDLVMESLDRVEPQPDGAFLLVDIFGKQREITGAIQEIDLLNKRIVVVRSEA